MKWFQIRHPNDSVYLCDHVCDAIADYLMEDDIGHQYLECQKHTKCKVHAAVLPKKIPNELLPHRTRLIE
jgi:hypothetical protein